MSTIVLDPTAETTAAIRPAAPRLSDLAGSAIAVVDISKPRGDVFLDRIVEILRQRDVEILRFTKPTHTRPAPADLRREITMHAGAVIQALAD